MRHHPVRLWAFSAGALFASGSIGVNALAYRHAFVLTHFSAGQAGVPSLRQVLVAGRSVPRPENDRTPADLGLKYEIHAFAGAHGLGIEAWSIDVPDGRGTVILFHGHTSSKSAMLPEAQQMVALGYNAFLVDFHGAGGSMGRETSLGLYEAQDVSAAYHYVERLHPGRPVVLYGMSMGAVAVLRAVAQDGLAPAALILQAPFGRLAAAARHHLNKAGLPAFPIAPLLLFWGGVQLDADLFAHNPVDYAAHVDRPTLLLIGQNDPYVSEAEANAIIQKLKGPRALSVCEGVGHDSCFTAAPLSWTDTVSRFLKAEVPTATAGAKTASRPRKARVA